MSRDTQAIAKMLSTLLRTGRGRASAPWLIVGCVLLGAYLFAEPWLEAKCGVDLPGVHKLPGAHEPTGGTVVADPPSKNSPKARDSQPDAQVDAPTSVDDLLASNRSSYTSPAGLRYSRGTVHGHHLRHLMAHTRDEPNRPVHGVFDTGDLMQVIGLVDEAYEQALAGSRTEKRVEGDRTIYIVNLGRRIGYVGGKSGARHGHPAARHVQLVLIGKKLITAYPTLP